MTSNRKTRGLLALLLILVLMLALPACKSKKDESEPKDEPQQEQQDEPIGTEEGAEIVKTISDIDVEGSMDIPLQIESITLYSDGSVKIIPTDDLLKIAETNHEVVDGAVYPFEESGEVKDVYLVRFGNGGYRTVICILEDGTLSALSAEELITDHITVVWDNLTGRDTYVSIREVQGDDSFSVIGITEDGEEVELDFSLNF